MQNRSELMEKVAPRLGTTSKSRRSLENKEIEFVIGHEIGHFIYGHGLALASSDTESLEFSIQNNCPYY